MIVRTRVAIAEDCERISRLLQQGDRLHALLLPDVFCQPQEMNRPLETLTSVITSDASDYILAEAEGDLLGVASIRIGATPAGSPLRPQAHAILDHMVVEERSRHLGVGKALLRYAQQWARNRHLQFVQITVWAANAEALQFYARQGFRLVSQKMELRVREAT